jgi:hypothetical protein
LQGVPTEVAEDVTSKFTVRVYTEKIVNGVEVIDRFSDRTFSLTVTGNDVPEFTTPAGSLGDFYDGDEVSYQIQYTGTDPNEILEIKVAAGELPPGLTISPTGNITGYIQPATNIDQPPGYDLTPIYVEPYDFVVEAINKNYQFTLEVTDGKSSNLRTFTMFVYARETISADNTEITADNTFVTADQTQVRDPFLLNATPTDLGKVRSDNYFAYRFVGKDYDAGADDLEYALTVNTGVGLAPGLTLDPYSGWYYGYIPDQGTTETEYSFNVQVRLRSMVCTKTTAGTNVITADNANREDVYVGEAITFEGTTFGGIVAGTTYYILNIVNNTEFTISSSISGPAVTLSSATGSMLGVPADLSSSRLYPFTITLTGALDSEVTWLTNSDLGTIENGSTSLLKVEAVNRGGRELTYKLKSGAYNQLPQGLTLLPTGEIAGRTTFNTFAIDLGTTTFDKTQSNITGVEETTFDSSFVFTVTAFAEDTRQTLYDVESISVVDGGVGYSDINLPTLEFTSPVGASAVTALAGNVTVSGGAITAVQVADNGAGYLTPPTITITQGFGGSGAELEPVMRETGTRDVISVDKTFTVKVLRAYNKPYQNLFCVAMPPQNDRTLINSLLSNQEIFVPEYIFRPDDPNFGLSTQIQYEHAYGLDPESLDAYVGSLYLNHYWKQLILGSIETAQALDADGNVLYEVVYSKVVDNLVNADGQSVSKIVSLPYPIIDPADGSTIIREVYPNSLINMRDQVVDVVGQMSTKLPLWMTSKQKNGRVLGFTPAWVICYTNPGRSNQIAYYMQEYFGTQLNLVDFKVDRYVLDRTLSKNWDTTTQSWTPESNLTTFDRFSTSSYSFLGQVGVATSLAFSDVNQRDAAYINNLGGLDGQTWIAIPGQTPPIGTKVIVTTGTKLVFAKQEDYNGPPGSSYPSTDNAWQLYSGRYDEFMFDQGPTTLQPSLLTETYDEGSVIPGGYLIAITATSSSTNRITCDSTAGMLSGAPIWFTGTSFGNIVPFSSGSQVYYILDIVDSTHFTITNTPTGTAPVSLSTDTGTMAGSFGNERMAIWQVTITVDNLVELTNVTPSVPLSYVQVTQGASYRSAQLYRPTTPGTDLTRVSWLPLPTVVTTETTFDEDSMQFIEPVDMYDSSDALDKYLVFPRTNILV